MDAGSGTGERFLIVNADDLGMTEAVNEGIFAAHREGVVTSASLMVLQGGAEGAVAGLGSVAGLAVGLHLDLSGWDYGAGGPLAEEHRCGIEDAEAVERECRGQVERFRELTGREPTHLDSHKHVHDFEPVVGVARRLAAEVGVPLRGVTTAYEGNFYARNKAGESHPVLITPMALLRLIEELDPGWTEIGCHPAADHVPSSYDGERRIELDTLRDPEVREAIAAAGVELRGFADVPKEA